MRDICLGIIFFGFVFAINGDAQVTKRGVLQPAASSSPSTKKPTFKGYEFRVQIDADGRSHLSVLTGFESTDLNNSLLKTVLSEYLEMQTPTAGRKPVGPRVFIDPDPNLDFKTVVEVIRAVRVSSSAQVLVVIPDGPFLIVPTDPKFDRNINIKPNPLTLIAALTKESDITLNNEKFGTLADLSKMTAKLKDIFKQREENGVFREGTNEVEKTVYVKIQLSASWAELIKITRALQIAGADPIGLQVDDLPDWVVDVRKELIKIP